ncbi:MAG: right-handed parallel beta-helix repeat-containing protein [Thermoplasmatota archaeon]
MNRGFLIWMVLATLLSAGFLGMVVFVDETDGLTITSNVTWASDQSLTEDVFIQSGGQLTINAGVKVNMGNGNRIVVNDGTLIAQGQWNNRIYFSLSEAPNLWGGIELNEDAHAVIDKAEIRFASVGIKVLGAGHSGTTNSVSITNTSFITCTKGVYMDGSSETGPFKCTFRDNNIGTADYSVDINFGFNGVAIENNEIYSCFENGILVQQSTGVRIMNNTITDSRFGITAGFIGGGVTLVENNTLRNVKIGMNGAFLAGGYTKILNNSFFCTEKGIWMGLMSDILIENNTITVLGDLARYPIEIESGTPASVVKNNILSACPYTMMINGTAGNHIIYGNLLLNLTDSGFIDNDGDGYCDMDPLLQGTAGAYAKKCRTSIHHVGSSPPTTTYVNPAQAAKYAPSGSTLFMISDPASYGPKALEKRHIYHTNLPVITRPMHFIGEEKEMLVFYPGACMDSPMIENTNNAGIENVTVEDGIYTVRVDNSNNITLKNIDSWAYDDPFFDGIDINGGTDILIEGCSLQKSYYCGLNISDSNRIEVRNTNFILPELQGIYVENSRSVFFDNVECRLPDVNGLVAKDSDIHWDGSEINSRDDAVVIDNCPGSSLSNLEIRSLNTNDVAVRIHDSPGVIIDHCDIQMAYHIVDYKGIILTGDDQDLKIDGCIFIGSDLDMNGKRAIYGTGNISGSLIRNCTFSDVQQSITIMENSGTIPIIDFKVSNCSFISCGIAINTRFHGNMIIEKPYAYDLVYAIENYDADMVIWNAIINRMMTHAIRTDGNLEIHDSEIMNTPNGIYQEQAPGTSNKLDIHSTSISAYNYGIKATAAVLTVSGSTLSSGIQCINMIDTDGSRITDSTLLGDVPIGVGLNTDPQNSAILENCTGNYTGTSVGASDCMATWVWPLEVQVRDEIHMPQPSQLVVDSPTYGEVVNQLIDGDRKVNLIGYYKDDSGGYDVSEYTVTVSEGGEEQDEDLEMLSWQELFFVFNHDPEVTGSAPTEITFNEDGTWRGNISGWFQDRDALVLSVGDHSPGELNYELDGDMLEISADDDWSGEGTLQLSAVDTFDVEVLHDLDIHVLPVNDPPYLVMDIPELNTTEDTSLWINLSGYGADIDSSPLTWSNLTAENLTLDWDESKMNLTITPVGDWFGKMNITLIMSDGEYEVEANLALTVFPVNDPPVWTGDPVLRITVKAGESLRISVQGQVEDVDNVWSDMVVTFDSSRVSRDGGDIIVLYPADTRNMTELITVTISDGGATTSFQIDVTVIEKTVQPEEWKIEDATVTVDEETGDWTVIVEAPEGLDIYIVIEGVGSFKLEETRPGHYEVVIPGDTFEEGKTYNYHFSDTEGGEDKTGGQFAGSKQQPVVADDDDDADDDDGEKGDEKFPLWILILIGIIVLLVIIVIVLVLTRRGAAGDYYEE